jgi:cytochrome c551/c552
MLLAEPQPSASTPAQRAAAAHAGPLFAHSDNCVACHNNLTTPQGEDVSIGATWRSTMMANSARDPYWHASVRREAIDHAGQSAEIQNECATCHMPIAERTARVEGRKAELFSLLPMSGARESDAHALAADGVSCTVCHQISSQKLGQPESFNGNFVLNPARADGMREIFGPFAVDPGRRRIMRSVTGFEQVEGAHVRQSELCATCHTLITQALGPDGRVIGSLPEQMNYQEWRHSDFPAEQKSCQSCHMPAAPGPIRVSSVLGEYRDTLSRHAFVGGNAFMIRMLNRYRTELGIEASPAELEATAQATLRQLADTTATMAIDRVTANAGAPLSFDVVVTNLTGHKFPTGYPARRTWLHAIVRDRQGRVVFESGAVDEQGRIAGNDSDRDGALFEPHYDRITAADQVQIYESIMGDVRNVPTTGLLTATQYLKDNRLLPRGFNKTTADAGIAVHGDALRDATFTGGTDRVTFAIDALRDGGYEIEVELRYQPIGYRWADNLASYDAPEPKRFVGYYRSLASGSSALVAHARR